MTDRQTELAPLTVEEIDAYEHWSHQYGERWHGKVTAICAAARLSVCGQAAPESRTMKFVPREYSGDKSLCPECGTKLKTAGGIGQFCPNKECPVSDDIDGYWVPAPTLRDEPIAEEDDK